MNKHTKLFVAFLFALLVVLVIATVSFSIDISKNSNASQENSLNSAINSNGNQIFQNEDGMYGLEDAGGNTLIDADWEQLQFLNIDYLAAVTETDEGKRMGVLDLDGNIASPFVYQDIRALTASYFLASFADSAQCVLYDSKFRIVESTVWDSCTYEKSQIILTKENDVFYFTVEDAGLVLTEVAMSRISGDSTFETNWNGTGTAFLSSAEWSYTADMMQQLLTMILSDDFTSLMSITDQNHEELILTSASQISQSILRADRTAYVSVGESDDGACVVTWQIDVSVRTDEVASHEQTITVTMKKNQQEVWVITELQFD